MDAKKTNRLISELRTEKGLTQKELASKLQVTDKAISRWETGKGYPEATIMQALSESMLHFTACCLPPRFPYSRVFFLARLT